MTISRAFRAAGKVYFGKPADVFCFMLVELCLTAACFSFALFLTMKNGWIPALLCIPAYLLLMLPVFWRWVIGAMPRGVALDAIPDSALPPSRT